MVGKGMDGVQQTGKLKYEASNQVDADNNENLTMCTCKEGYDPRKFMIECGKCDRWYHGTCVNVTEETAFNIIQYICPTCVKQGAQSQCMSLCVV